MVRASRWFTYCGITIARVVRNAHQRPAHGQDEACGEGWRGERVSGSARPSSILPCAGHAQHGRAQWELPEKDIPMKKQAKRGRPTRAAASAKALATVDLAGVDPRLILQQIAADASAPASARVMAARALLNQGETSQG
jgi:hypothetical protein